MVRPGLKGSQKGENYALGIKQVKAKADQRIAVLLIRKYPIPILALSALIVGSFLQWGLGMSIVAGWLWFATLLVGGIPVVWETARNLARKNFASDIVATLAILSAIALNDAFPGMIIVLMQTGGKALEDFAFRRASSSLETLLARSPRIAHRIANAIIEDVAVEDVRIGDTLVVRPGDLIPVDGVVTRGSSMVDEASLTGEPYPKLKTHRDIVYSGTINLGEAFEMTAEKRSSESQYSKIVELVRKAQQDKAPLQRLADKYAVWFTPVTLVVGVLGWVLTRHPETFLSVLVVATPCSLIFATPVAIISGINRAARKGIVVKHGAAIEQVGKAKAVVFDKTGTITYGAPEVRKIVSFGGRYSEDDLLFKAASAEQFSSHPAAQALVAMAIERFGQRNLSIPSNFKEIPGAGVQCLVDGHTMTIGSKQLLERDIEEYEWPSGSSIVDIGADGGMVAFVAIDHKVEGAITFGDIIRPGVAAMIDDLHSMKINETILLTGDNRINARSVASSAGFDRVEYELLPEDKVAYVRALKEKSDGTAASDSSIVMVGDGINDAPALASATVGIAMGARGTAISAEAADIVLLVDDVTKTCEIIKISRRTIRIAMQSIIVGLGTSLLLMGIASTGTIPPTTGALLQEALDVAVILNAVRAR